MEVLRGVKIGSWVNEATTDALSVVTSPSVGERASGQRE